jgi:hypothetical protein
VSGERQVKELLVVTSNGEACRVEVDRNRSLPTLWLKNVEPFQLGDESFIGVIDSDTGSYVSLNLRHIVAVHQVVTYS